ncbi:MAG: SPFH domain-containing protein [Armatimonadota bacterium]|nr:SPFH domain-containing protein [Armatimonadota bacterium]
MSRNSGGAGCGVMLLLPALALIVGPLLAGPGMPGGQISQLVCLIFGSVLLLLGAIVITYSRLYRKAASNESFVRTGWGGSKCVIDGGALVIPVLHNTTPVSLETMRLDVSRMGKDALITGDNLRADVEAEFYIKVNKDEHDIIAAATSLGDRSVNSDTVKELVEQKLISALRTVAATKTLNQLHTERQDFAESVQKIVEQDLKPNGLTLESVTISRLDQTPPNAMREQDNVFDAQGLKTIAGIVNAQRVERTKIERQADQLVKQQEVATQKFVYEQERERAQAEAEQALQIKQARSEAQQKADTFAAEQEAKAGVAVIKKDEGMKVAEVERQRAIEVANQEREKAAQIAEIEKTRSVEISTREKEIAVALKEKERAQADAERFAVEAAREEKRQAVQTVEVTKSAERDKSRTIIDEQAKIEKDRLRRQMEADVTAYAAIKTAEGEKEAAAKKAEAFRITAEAQKDAKVLESQGQKAVQMVPVEVEQRRVEVERARVDVKAKDLEIQARHQEIAKDLQIALAQIQASKEAQIAAAQAMGNALGNANMTIWGDPQSFQRMSSAFYRGQEIGQIAGGFIQGAPDGVKATIGELGQVGAALIKRFTGKDVDPEEVEQVIETARKNGAAAQNEASVPDGTEADGAGSDGANPAA